MGRRKIEIKPIKDEQKRVATFSKRRDGLVKKLEELCVLCDAQGVSIVFPREGEVNVAGHPAAESVLNRYLAFSGRADVGKGLHHDGGGAEEAPLTEEEKRICAAVEGLGFEELGEFEAEMEKINRRIAAEIAARGLMLPNFFWI